MKKRFNKAWRAVVVFLVTSALLIAFPIWIAIWLITGWDWQLWMNKFLDPEWAKSMNLTKQEWKEAKKILNSLK